MRGNSFGKMLSISSFGESHGAAIGVVIDGMPPGVLYNENDLQAELDRRAPGRLKGTTSRVEADKVEILSGVFEGKTLGTPLTVIVRNTNQKSGDYDGLKDNYRPGHADKTTEAKYGIRDHRGGGRSSGRETVARVIGGYFAGLMLKKVTVRAWVSKLGPFEFTGLPKAAADFGPYSFPDLEKNKEIENYLVDLKQNGESRGGTVRVLVDNCPIGLGEPAFDKLKADLAKGLISIGACFSFSFGLGEEMADHDGSFVSSDTNNFGGIEGGISNGNRILMKLTFKPTSTIGDKAKEGRHDPCIIPRAIPVVESMVKLVLADHLLRQNAYINL